MCMPPVALQKSWKCYRMFLLETGTSLWHYVFSVMSNMSNYMQCYRRSLGPPASHSALLFPPSHCPSWGRRGAAVGCSLRQAVRGPIAGLEHSKFTWDPCCCHHGGRNWCCCHSGGRSKDGCWCHGDSDRHQCPMVGSLTVNWSLTLQLGKEGCQCSGSLTDNSGGWQNTEALFTKSWLNSMPLQQFLQCSIQGAVNVCTPLIRLCF